MGKLQDVQNQPENVRKTILWVTVIILAIVLLFFWGKNVKQRFKEIDVDGVKSDLNIPALQEELKNLPDIDI
jgi:uncharacterized membrane protein